MWAAEYPFSEHHGGGTPCLYAIETHDPEAWLKSAKPLTEAIRQQYEDQIFLDRLGPEIGPELCQHEGCQRKRVRLSVMCQQHHFEMVKKRSSPSEQEHS